MCRISNQSYFTKNCDFLKLIFHYFFSNKFTTVSYTLFVLPSLLFYTSYQQKNCKNHYCSIIYLCAKHFIKIKKIQVSFKVKYYTIIILL